MQQGACSRFQNETRTGINRLFEDSDERLRYATRGLEAATEDAIGIERDREPFGVWRADCDDTER